ncbi:MAG: alpha/beta fold hydrolase, partial [Acidimicrobiia bacterium]
MASQASMRAVYVRPHGQLRCPAPGTLPLPGPRRSWLPADETTDRPEPEEGHLLVGETRLYWRRLGVGHPIVVLHGGPDFDHNYLLPEMDRLAAFFRLIYYDQRGRGLSGEGVQAKDVTISSEIEDLDALTDRLGLGSFALLGHSWGGFLAMEYAIRHPGRISHLILMNTAPASHRGLLLTRQHLAEVRPGEAEEMAALASTERYLSGDLETDAEYYRLHFRAGLPRPEHLDLLVPRLRANLTEEGVRKARAIEQRLYEQTWWSPDYDLLPTLGGLDIPTLVLHGEKD